MKTASVSKLTALTNLKPTRSGNMGWKSGNEGKVITVSLSYSKGGMNYFTGRTDPRGIWIFIRPIEIKDGFESFIITEGIGLFVEELKAKSDKKLQAAAERFDGRVLELAAAWTEHGAAGVRSIVNGVLAAQQQEVASAS